MTEPLIQCRPRRMQHVLFRAVLGLGLVVWLTMSSPCVADDGLSGDLSAQSEPGDRAAAVPAGGSRAITPPKSRDAHGALAPRKTNSDSAWLTTVGGLATVFGVLGIVVWAARKHLPTAPKGLPRTVIEVLGRKTLDPRTAIHLVRCGSRILVLGTTPAGMVSLAEIKDSAEVDFLSGLCRADDPAEGGSFLDIVSRFRQRGTEPPEGSRELPDAGELRPARPEMSVERTSVVPDMAASRLRRRMSSDRPAASALSGQAGSLESEAPRA